MKDQRNKKSRLTKISSNRSYSYFKRSFDLPNPGLAASFARIRVGNDEEYRTPFYKGKSLKTVLNNWNRTLRKIAAPWPSLYEFEVDLGSKVGPMSLQLPLEDRMTDIDAYYDLILKDQIPFEKEALDRALDEWNVVRKRIPMRGQFQTMLKMKKSTNSGSPFYTRRADVVSKTIPATVFPLGRDVIQQLNGTQWAAAAVLGWRGQEGGPEPEDVKQRVIWMFPFGVNVCEQQVYQPLIEEFQKFDLIPAWVSTDKVDDEITRLFDTKSPRDVIVCTDFSKFDQHFNPTCQAVARELIKQLMADQYDLGSWIDDVFPIKYMIPLAYDYGKVRFGRHGMASGSGGTNADETLVHRVLQHEAALQNGEILNPHSQCLGDDGILSYPGITVDDVIRSYTAHGLEMNPEKQYVSTQDCVYLRRWHHDKYRIDGKCVGVYSTNRALGRLMEQERFYDPEKWSKEMVALRQLSIIENCKYHPLREEFADFCMKGDKYWLGLGIPGFIENISSYAQKATEYMPDFLGYTRSLGTDDPARGIENWWIVQYLKSKLGKKR